MTVSGKTFMDTYTYIGSADVPAAAMETRLGQACTIVAAVPDSTDPDPTNDMFRVQFSDGVSRTPVYPEELDPIPAPGTGR